MAYTIEDAHEKMRAANQFTAQGDYGSAMEELNQVEKMYYSLNVTDGMAAVNKLMGDILSRQGKFNTALRRYDKAVKYLDQLEQTKEIDNILNTIYFVQGTLYRQLGEPYKAISKYLNLIRQNAFENQPAHLASCLEQLGELYLETGEVYSAIQYIGKALDLYTSMKSLDKQAKMYLLLGKCEDIRGNFRKVIE